ncbi:YbaB/EbfC family nucleoid-associated protein [Rhodoligotrophos defluvii]|uniref:YbaB/EbfC family nucleoid-associated protein n=1 Tax=Rhodoligotrophos defluvii TaxID=2561934 RepID=UPI0010CA0B21|nr:YbaB/EbfC family nucleoid-associated protein [Rhodoligotrophos defluvii]
MKNLGDMMKQMQEMQARMQEMQARLEELDVVGTAGAGLVSVTLNGKGAMKGISIDPTLLTDDREILEDLIVAAHADARQKMESALAEEMKQLTGGLPLPPGLNFGF